MKTKNKNILYKKRLSILESSIKIISDNGWNQNTFKLISKNTIFSINEINILFSEGYIGLLKFSLDQINIQLQNKFNSNLLRLPLHKRIRKILISKFELMNQNKEFYRQTFLHLLLPNNSKILFKQLYKSVDLMWYIAGDYSTDFNFYTKRIILSGIYSRLSLFFFNNRNFKKMEEILDSSLNAVSKIPKYKHRINTFKNSIPSLFTFIKSF